MREDAAAYNTNASWCCEVTLTLWAGLATVLDPTLHNLKIVWFDLISRACGKQKKTAQHNFEPKYPPSNQTNLVSPAPCVVPRLPLRGWGGICFTKTTVARCADSIFRKKSLSFVWSPFLFISALSSPHGLCNAGGLVAVVPFSHLDTKDETYLLGTWLKAPKKKSECSGTLKSALDKSVTAGCNCLNHSRNCFFFYQQTTHWEKSLICVAIAAVFCF